MRCSQSVAHNSFGSSGDGGGSSSHGDGDHLCKRTNRHDRFDLPQAEQSSAEAQHFACLITDIYLAIRCFIVHLCTCAFTCACVRACVQVRSTLSVNVVVAHVPGGSSILVVTLGARARNTTGTWQHTAQFSRICVGSQCETPGWQRRRWQQQQQQVRRQTAYALHTKHNAEHNTNSCPFGSLVLNSYRLSVRVDKTVQFMYACAHKEANARRDLAMKTMLLAHTT